jgi:hypothetical protein
MNACGLPPQLAILLQVYEAVKSREKPRAQSICISILSITQSLIPFPYSTVSTSNFFDQNNLKMHFPTIPLLALLALTTAAPLPLPDNTSSITSNALANGINANLDAGNQEIQSVQTLQSSESNNAPAAQIQSNIASLQGALNTAVADREGNQALAAAQKREPSPADAALTAGLDKVASAQANAQGAISSLNGGAGDAATLSALGATFQKGFETNENNLALVCMPPTRG